MVKSYQSSVQEVKDLSDIYELATEENNKVIVTETLQNIISLKNKTKKMKLNVFFLMKVIF